MVSFRKASELERRAGDGWLVENLWGARAVGIIGGEPKSLKSFLALELALSVSSGTAALSCFAVPVPGPVLLFPAEDAQHIVLDRLEKLASGKGLRLEDLPLYVITEAYLHLDDEKGRADLEELASSLRPRLIILDPFVRMHTGDENASSSIVPVLSFLRTLERRYECSVILVHHMRKHSGSMRGGQSLRGSGELHAWGDSNLYLRWKEKTLVLTAEHRAHQAPMDQQIDLKGDQSALRLTATDYNEDEPVETNNSPQRAVAIPAPSPNLPKHTPKERVLAALSACDKPISQRRIRKVCGMRMVTVAEVLGELQASGTVLRVPEGYCLPPVPELAPATLEAPVATQLEPALEPIAATEAPGEEPEGS